MNKLSERKAWRLIARSYEARATLDAYDDYGYNPAYLAADPMKLSLYGFCNAIATLSGRRLISFEVRDSMKRKVDGALTDRRKAHHASDGHGLYVLDLYNSAGAARRVILATIFAEMSR